MREILFRGKRMDNGEWVEGYYLHQRESLTDKETWYIVANNGYGFNYISVLPETVGQFTNLTDKNGNKIFEGDIMRNAGNVVEFYNGDFCINGDSPLSYWTGTEVIGNIHDNSNLL